jgi:hypothetical protein
MARGFKKKGPFDDLDKEFRETIENMSDEDIKKRVSEVAIAEHENRQAKAKDQDLSDKVAAVKFAGEQYREASKMNKLRIGYAHFILESRGKV